MGFYIFCLKLDIYVFHIFIDIIWYISFFKFQVDINAENKAYEKACALNHIQSCLCLAANYENGRGFERNEKKSNELVKKAQSLARLEQMRQLYAER